MSIRFQADNDFKFGIVKAVRRLESAIDFASAQESGFDGVGDPELLDRAPIGQVVEAIACVWELADSLDLRDQAHYLPSLSRHVFSR